MELTSDSETDENFDVALYGNKFLRQFVGMIDAFNAHISVY